MRDCSISVQQGSLSFDIDLSSLLSTRGLTGILCCIALVLSLFTFSTSESHPWCRSRRRESFISSSSPFEKLLCRCNLPAQNCVQLRHGIWLARNVVLCLVRGTVLFNKQHLQYVSECCGNALSLVLTGRHRVLLHVLGLN